MVVKREPGQTPIVARKKVARSRPETLGDRIGAVRTGEGMSQGEFALALARAGGRPPGEARTQSQISAMEHGDSGVPVEVVAAIGNMGYDLEWLLYGKSRSDAAQGLLAGSPALLRIMADLQRLGPAQQAFVQQWLELYVQSLRQDGNVETESWHSYGNTPNTKSGR